MFKVQKCLTSGPENKFCLLTSFDCNPHRAFKIVKSLSVVLNWDTPHKNPNFWLFSSPLATRQQERSDSFLFSSRSQWDGHLCSVCSDMRLKLPVPALCTPAEALRSLEGLQGQGWAKSPGCDEGEGAERKDQAPGSGQCARPSSLGPHRERLGACRVSPGQCGLGALGTEARLSLCRTRKKRTSSPEIQCEICL